MDTAHRYFHLAEEEVLKKMALLRDDELEWVKDKA
jgi:hypothetical protein